MSKNVPIIIVGYNGQDYSEQCINSIYKHTKIPFTLIAVDNGSEDDTDKVFKQFAKEHDNFVHISLDKNLGFAGGYNTGIQYAIDNLNFDYLLILNNDLIVTPNYMEQMLHCFSHCEKDLGISKVGCVGPMSNYVAGRQCTETPHFNSTEDIDKFALAFQEINKNRCSESGRLIGFAMLFSNDVIREVKGFDDRFFPGMFEDNDIALRMRAAGYKSVIAEDTFIYHYGSKTVNNMKECKSSEMFYRNKEKFYDKWANIRNIDKPKKLVGICRVKNGEAYLNETLAAVSRMCDELIVFDDHSTDKTKEICELHKVNYYKSEFTTFDEARDRNFIINKAKELNPDWIYCFDADEIPEESLIKNVQALLNDGDPEKKAFIFRICHLWNSPGTVRMDGLWGTFWQCRLFKNEPNQTIVSKGDDNNHCGSHPAIPPENMAYTKFRIKHYGNMDPAERARKYSWYTKTDTDKDIGAILGGYANYYKSLYYGKIDVPMKDEDFYRHLIDETDIRLVPWVENNLISVCMIAKDEEAYIEQSLQSVKSFADEIILVLDSRSSDNTEQIARKYTNKIYRYAWNEGAFSSIRNYANSLATGEWIFRIDADEIVPVGVGNMILQATQFTDVSAYLVSIKNWQENPVGNTAASWIVSETMRLHKNRPWLYYSGLVHEDLYESLQAASKREKIRLERFGGVLEHYGYLKESSVVKAKHDFYAALLIKQLEKAPSDFMAHLNYAVHLCSRNQLDEAEIHFLKAIEINPKCWTAHNELGSLYYKKALNMELLSKATCCYQKALATLRIEPLANSVHSDKVLGNMRLVNSIRNSAK